MQLSSPSSLPRLALLAMGLTCSLPTAAQTQRAEAREHFQKALAHVEAHELEPALAEFQAAYRAQPHFAVLYDIGYLQLDLGHPVAAVDAFERYLAEGGAQVPPERKTKVQRVIAEQSSHVSRLQVMTAPPGAQVRVDGADSGTSPFSRALVLKPGSHAIDVKDAGHASIHRSVELAPGTLLRVEIPLESERAPPARRGSLEIECEIPDVAISVDGDPVAHTPVASVAVSLGAHDVSFQRPGFSRSHASVFVTADGATAHCHNQPLEPPPAASSGRLDLDLPSSAFARVDGQLLGHDGRLAQGHHHVVVTADGYRTWEGEISIEHGKTLLVRPELEPDKDTVLQRQAQRTWAWALGASGSAVLVTAGGLFLWNNSRYSDWKETQGSLDQEWNRGPPQSTDLARRQTQNDQLLVSIRAFDRVSLGLAAGGGAMVITGAVLYLTGGDPNPPSRPTLIVERQSAMLGWKAPW